MGAKLQAVISELEAAKSSIRCDRLGALLLSLGFRVKDSKASKGHKIVTHPGLDDFKSASYNCGHGKNPEIKAAYITGVLRVLNQFQAELDGILGE